MDILLLHFVIPSQHLAPINNQIPQPLIRRQEFSYDYPHQTKPDINLHIADDQRDGARNQYLR